MYYVELLRVLRTLRTVGYILGTILLLALMGRPFSHGDSEDPLFFAAADHSQVNTRTNPDGTVTKSLIGRGGKHIAIRTTREGIQTITVTEPLRPGGRSRNHVTIGPGGAIQVDTHNEGRHRVVVVTRDLHIPLFVLVLICGAVAAVVATILGLALSRENDGHLELAWTKPVSRPSYLLSLVVVDCVGIVVAALGTLVLVVLILAVYGDAQYIRADARLAPTLAFAAFFALSFYGIVLAATSSMRRGGLVLSLLWPVALVLPGLVAVQWMSLGAIARLLNTINPVAYFYAFASSPNATQVFTLMPNGTVFQILAPLAIFAAGVILSLAQWRRLEA